MKTIPSLDFCAAIPRSLRATALASLRAVGFWRAERGWLSFCLGALLWCGVIHQGQCQTALLGGAVFAATSDQIPADWYWPMPANVTFTYDGYGTLEGGTRTETYLQGQWVAGVKTVKWHTETRTSAVSATTVEDWWLARDMKGNLRVLKIMQSGSTTFVASAGKAPPIFLPGVPAKGQTWDFLGNTFAIEAVMTSANAGSGIKLSITAPGSEAEYYVYNAGVGVAHDAMTQNPAPSGSGWALRPQ